MNESRVYNFALIAGVFILLAGIVFHWWMAVAIGALIAGVGGVFGMFSTIRR